MSGYNSGYGTGTGYANLLSQLQANPAQQQVLPGWRHVPGVGTLPMGNGQPQPQPILPPPNLGGGGMGGGGGYDGGGGMGGGGTGFIFNKPQGQDMPPMLGGGSVMGQPSGIVPQGGQGNVMGPLGRFGGILQSMDPSRRMALGMGLNMMRGGLGI